MRPAAKSLHKFIHNLDWDDLPEAVQTQARRCLIDTVGAALGGRQTRLSQIIYPFVHQNFGGETTYLWFSGAPVSAPGAALAHGLTIDSLDIHDGHTLVKGHAGAAVVPAALATSQLQTDRPVSGAELLTTLVVGYEIALRAGIVLHETACDYHTSGAWNALGCAAITARRLNLSVEATRHALGTAEYHGPRSQMMRVVDHPTMLKDGIGWGAMAGVSAGLMAQLAFTGAPAITIEAPSVAHYWADLGTRWRILDLYFKPFAICRWAQPAVTAALNLKNNHGFQIGEIKTVDVFTFHEAVRLNHPAPDTTETAQYSLPFPLAAALIDGQLGPKQLSGAALKNPKTLDLAKKITLHEETAYNELFPAERVAHIIIHLKNGTALKSGPTQTDWESHSPPGDQALLDKFKWLAEISYPPDYTHRLQKTLWDIHTVPDLAKLHTLLAAHPPTIG